MSGTQREMSEELGRGRVEVDGNVKGEAARGRGPECKRGNGHCRNGLTEPSTRSECVDGSKAH